MSIVSQVNHLDKQKLISFDSNRLSHAYITDDSFADTLATAVVCSERSGKRPCLKCADCNKALRNIHPDIITAGKMENKLIITVDQIRALKKDVYILPNDSMQKAYIIKNADSMNINAQNAILQILEEPPAHVVFILCAENTSALLPTVRSRCIDLKNQISYEPVDEEDSAEQNELINSFIEAISNDNVKLMQCMFKIDKLDRQSLNNFIEKAREQVIFKLRENINNNTPEKIKAFITAEETLSKTKEMMDLNVSAGHISGFICASLL